MGTAVVGTALVLALGAAGRGAAQTITSSQKVAVLKTDVTGLDAGVGAQVTARMSEVLRQRTSAEVISSDEIVSLLKHEKERAILGSCNEDQCMAELANALGADVIVSGKLTKVDAGLVLSISAVDARTASVRARVSETWGGESIVLLSLVRPMIDRLLVGDAAPPSGALEVVGAADGSRIVVDDTVRGTAPAGQLAVVIGAHKVTVQRDGMVPFDRWVVVDKDAPTQLAVQQVAVEEPFYGTWWFWTAAGAGVVATAAAITGVALLANGGATGVNVQVNADTAFAGAR
jgi:hypothetical protein